jgi:pimeloyl-ACP methyl ester carboxylesterase
MALARDLRGVARLGCDATLEITHIVEGVHGSFARLPGPLAMPARSLSSFVYGSIRAIAGGVRFGADRALALLESEDRDASPDPAREALLAALNGVVGDHLAADGNPFAIPMQFRAGGRAVRCVPEELAATFPNARRRLVILVHGLCMSDLQWHRGGHHHGVALERDHDVTAIHLHYNSGRHVSQNGRELADQLESLVSAWPVPIQEIHVIGHSMGGLVTRSALHYATIGGRRWPSLVSRVVYLGTPHHGASLERAGNRFHALAGSLPFVASLAVLGRLRSAGITDLRHGNLLDEDWQGSDRFDGHEDRRSIVPLAPGVRHLCVAATLAERPGALVDRLAGDGLVPLDSATGRHRDPQRSLAFEPEALHVVARTGHLDLLSHPDVYRRLRAWIGGGT